MNEWMDGRMDEWINIALFIANLGFTLSHKQNAIN